MAGIGVILTQARDWQTTLGVAALPTAWGTFRNWASRNGHWELILPRLTYDERRANEIGRRNLRYCRRR